MEQTATANHHHDVEAEFARLASLGDWQLDVRNYSQAIKTYEKALSLLAQPSSSSLSSSPESSNSNSRSSSSSSSATHEKVKNNLAFAISQHNADLRQEHFDARFQPGTAEQRNERLLMRHMSKITGADVSLAPHTTVQMSKTMDDLVKRIGQSEPTFLEVCRGHEYRDGSLSLKQDMAMAAKCYERAARAHTQPSSAEAMYNLALLYQKGAGVERDFAKSLRYLERACAQPPTVKRLGIEMPNVGVAESLHALGLAYEQGTYVARDTAKAIAYYEQAVSLNNADSANNLALIYASQSSEQGGDGEITRERFESAERLLLFAHKLDNGQAVDNLVDLYMSRGDQLERALMWHERSLAAASMYAMSRDKEIRAMIKMNQVLRGSYGGLATTNTTTTTPPPTPSSAVAEDGSARVQAILGDFRRVNLIVSHREYHSGLCEARELMSSAATAAASTTTISNNTWKPPKRQAAATSNAAVLRQVYIKDMDLGKDHIVHDAKMRLKNLDVAVVSAHSTTLVVEDDLGYAERMAVYNLSSASGRSAEETAKAMFPVGRTFTVLSPYVRMAADGKPIIRIDDPSHSLQFDDDDKDDTTATATADDECAASVCRFCMQAGAKFKCARCSNACYCSKQCQINDWKTLKHKLVCKRK